MVFFLCLFLVFITPPLFTSSDLVAMQDSRGFPEHGSPPFPLAHDVQAVGNTPAYQAKEASLEIFGEAHVIEPFLVPKLLHWPSRENQHFPGQKTSAVSAHGSRLGNARPTDR